MLRKFVCVLCLILTSCTVSPVKVQPASNTLSTPDVAAIALSTTVELYCVGKSYGGWFDGGGTGILLSKDLVLSAAHIFINLNRVSVGGTPKISVPVRTSVKVVDFVPISIVVLDSVRDLAVFRAARSIPGRPARFASRIPRVGESVFWVGVNPKSSVQDFRAGILSSVADTFISVSDTIVPGYSGAGVFNTRGEIIGMIRTAQGPVAGNGTHYSANLGFARRLEVIKAFLKLHEKRLKWRIDTSANTTR